MRVVAVYLSEDGHLILGPAEAMEREIAAELV